MAVKNRKNLALPLLTAVLYAVTFVYRPAVGQEAFTLLSRFLLEMLQIVPLVFLLTGLLAVWMPPGLIMQHFGHDAGWRGRGLSIVVGAVSAGPIYAAFPLAQTLLQKGASVSNVVIVISAWAVIKIPLVLAETRFLGPSFALTRYLLTVPAVLLLGIVAERLIGRLEFSSDVPQVALPGVNCGACGYARCDDLAKAAEAGEAKWDQCVVLRARQRSAG